MTDAPVPDHLGRFPGASPPLRVWEASGLLCAVARNLYLGIFIGYVLAPGLTQDQADGLDVHGGVTYGPDKHGWIGWDAGHFLDYVPGVLAVLPNDHDAMRPELHRWTQAEAEVETERLAAEAARLAPDAAAPPRPRKAR